MFVVSKTTFAKMKLKRKSTEISKNKSEWKPIAIDCEDGWNKDDFDGLVGIEELHDYGTIVNGKTNKRAKITDKDSQTTDRSSTKQKKKNAKKSKKNKENDKVEAEPSKSISKKVNSFNVEDISKISNQEQTPSQNKIKKKVLKPMLNMCKWRDLSVPEPLVECLAQMNMISPTPIQENTIKEAIDDRMSIYGAAPTGSGKTLAFAIPIITNILKDRQEMKESDQSDSSEDSVKAIVLTPTRELAVQIKKHIDALCHNVSLKSALIVGGLAIQKQERVLQRIKPDILVATPGRLWEIINSGTVDCFNRRKLVQLKYLVIDEADRMVEKAHFAELRQIVDLLNTNAIQRQIFIFSATLTMANKKKKKMNRHNKKEDDSDLLQLLKLKDKNSCLKTCDLTEGGLKSTPNSDQLQESIIHCMKDDKDLYLYYFITTNPGRTIVFCNSIDCIRRLVNIFRFLRINPLVVHSSMPQKRRLMNIERFTSNPNSVLFATDVASRGLDIPSVNHVVHYQVPRTADIYVHRSGRTARISAHGLSLILCDPQEEAFFLRDFFKILNKKTLDTFDVNSHTLKRMKERIRLAQQCDTLEHSIRKHKSHEDWFKASAKACEMETDSSDDELDLDDATVAKKEVYLNKRKLKNVQKQLQLLLKQNVLPKKSL